jgi:iron complex transport system ATP-binding protein
MKKDGRIVTHDASAVVLRPDILAQVFETPFEVLMHRGCPVVVAR